VNVYLKNKKHVLKLLIKVGVARLNNCPIKHSEGMKHLIALEAKQGEITRNCAMRALVTTNFPMFNQVFGLFSTFFRISCVKKCQLIHYSFLDVHVTSLSISIWGFFVLVFQQVVRMSYAGS